MSLVNALDGLDVLVNTLAGLKRTYRRPDESVSDFPCAVIYPWSGELTIANHTTGQNIHIVRIDFLAPRDDLKRAVEGLEVWPDRLQAAIKDDMTFGNRIAHTVSPIRYNLVVPDYAGIPCLALRFEIQMKVNELL